MNKWVSNAKYRLTFAIARLFYGIFDDVTIDRSLSRPEKEQLYLSAGTELETVRGRIQNEKQESWYIGSPSDDELDRGLEMVLGQLKYERGLQRASALLSVVVFWLIEIPLALCLLFALVKLIKWMWYI